MSAPPVNFLTAKVGTGAGGTFWCPSAHKSSYMAAQATYPAGATVTLESTLDGITWQSGVQTWDGSGKIITAPIIGQIQYRANVTAYSGAIVFTGGGLNDMSTTGGSTAAAGDVFDVVLTTNPLAAAGSITCVAKASLLDGQTVTISDGTNPASVFEFDVAGDGVTGPNVQVNVSTDTTAIQVAARLHAAINGVVGGLTVTSTDNHDGTLTLAADASGTTHNVAITETVANAGFLVSGMSGGTSADSFKWRKNGGSWSSDAVITAGTPQALSGGVMVTFAAGTGHTPTDAWSITLGGVTVIATCTNPFQLQVIS